MAKPLSQREIDVLLELGEAVGDDSSPALSSMGMLNEGEINALLEVGEAIDANDTPDIAALESMLTANAGRHVQPYNFKRPRLFSQDQMRVLNHVHESFARDLSVYLSAQLRTIVDISLEAVDQVLYSEFVMSSAPPSALYVVEEEELDHQIVFEIDPRLVIYTIEKLCGGSGIFLETPREVSQIEQRIMSKVMARAYEEMESSWEQAHDIKLQEVSFESNAEFVQIIPSVEPALVATFTVTISEETSFINLCYPYILLEKMLGRAGMNQWISSATASPSPEVKAQHESTLRSMPMEISAKLGRTLLPASEIMQLQEGDVIPLSQRVSEPIQVFVDEQEKFKARAGRSGRQRALRIVKVLDTPIL